MPRKDDIKMRVEAALRAAAGQAFAGHAEEAVEVLTVRDRQSSKAGTETPSTKPASRLRMGKPVLLAITANNQVRKNCCHRYFCTLLNRCVATCSRRDAFTFSNVPAKLQLHKCHYGAEN